MTKSKVKSRVRDRVRLKRKEQKALADKHSMHSSPRRAFVELSEDRKWIDVWFPYAPGILLEIKGEANEGTGPGIPGAHFMPKERGGPKWRVPRDLHTCDQLREIFGPTEFWDDPETGEPRHIRGLWIGDALRAWARSQRQLERNLGELTRAKDAKLKRIKKDSRIARAIRGEALPELDLPLLPSGQPHPLMVEREERSYQRADIRIMALANVMNANQPGTGKTIETIASWVESGALQEGPILVVSPVRSLEATWMKEILLWLGDHDDVSIYTDENPNYRKRQVEDFLNLYEAEEMNDPAILCLNYEWFRLVMTHKKGEPILSGIARCAAMPLDLKRSEGDTDEQHTKKRRELQNAALQKYGVETNAAYTEEDRLNHLARKFEAKHDHKGNIYGYANELQRRLLDVEWSAVTVDEFHKSGMSNRTTLFAQGISMIRAEWKSALSGTPMGGKPRKLWAIFHWLDPEEFPAEWRWIQRWLHTESGHSAHSKIVGGIIKGDEEKFGRAHARHMIRRTKLTALPGLPPKIEQVVWSKMLPEQEKQYHEFATALEIKIDEERLSAQNVLTEYTRLKQFANAKQRIVDGIPYPTEVAGKLEDIWEKLEENGVRLPKDDPEPGARAIIGSESTRFVNMLYTWLIKKGIACDTFTGETKDSAPILERFKRGGAQPYVIIMNYKTGGVSLDLEEAGSMHAADETWNPDDIEQFFDRGDRGSRTEPLRGYIYRTRATIQEYIAAVNEGKAVTNATVLDIRRRIHEMDERE